MLQWLLRKLISQKRRQPPEISQIAQKLSVCCSGPEKLMIKDLPACKDKIILASISTEVCELVMALNQLYTIKTLICSPLNPKTDL